MSGTFASIEKKQVAGGTFIAVKKYSRNHGNIVIRHYKREFWALKKLAIESLEACLEKHVIQLIDHSEVGLWCCLSLPFFSQTLTNKLTGSGDPVLAHDFLKQICKGLNFIHDKGIIHCDLSPGNILIDDSGRMVVSDFGCAHSLDKLSDNFDSHCEKNEVDEIGTRYYKAPEHLFGSKQYAPSTDVWSLGTLFFQILIGYPIFAGESDIEQIGIIVRSLGKPSAQVEEEEMSRYPDTNKLSFFSFPSYDDEDDEDDEDEDEDEDDDFNTNNEQEEDDAKLDDEDEYESNEEDYDSDDSSSIDAPPSRSLKSTLELEKVCEADKNMILNILTWSIKDRLTISEIQKLI